jgi:hypothetical protein
MAVCGVNLEFGCHFEMLCLATLILFFCHKKSIETKIKLSINVKKKKEKNNYLDYRR